MSTDSTARGVTLPEVSFSFQSADGGAWRVLQVHAREGLSELYEAVVDLATDDLSASPEGMLAQPCAVTFKRFTSSRHVCGLAARVEDLGTTDRARLARVVIAPELLTLAQRLNSRIFQQKSALDIVKDVLRDAGVYTGTLRDETATALPVREYCVQYHETDLAFVLRLLEDEGVGFYFAHDGEREAMVLIDAPRAFPAMQTYDGGDVPVTGPDQETASTESVRRYDWGAAMASTGVTLRDFDFTHPSAWVGMTRARAPGAREVYDYPGRYTINEFDGSVYGRHDGQRLAEVRFQEQRTWEATGRGQSNVTGLTPGHTFTLSDHGRAELNKAFAVTHVEHHGVAPEALREAHVDEIPTPARATTTPSQAVAAGVVLPPLPHRARGR
jgi:type VI secretion system secreted protein VgrG